jgi:hypothetical protein
MIISDLNPNRAPNHNLHRADEKKFSVEVIKVDAHNVRRLVRYEKARTIEREVKPAARDNRSGTAAAVGFTGHKLYQR